MHPLYLGLVCLGAILECYGFIRKNHQFREHISFCSRYKYLWTHIIEAHSCRDILDKNKELSQALRIKGLPTLMIYKKGEMVWRQSGEQDANTLIGILNEYL